LVAAAVGAGILFYQVVEPFLFPLFFASVLALLFWPLHVWVTGHICFGHRRLSAAVMTVGILLIVMLPISVALVLSAQELIEVGREIVEWIDPQPRSEAERQVAKLQRVLTAQQFQQVRYAMADANAKASTALVGGEGSVAGKILTRLCKDFPHQEVVDAFERQSQTPVARFLNHPLIHRWWQRIGRLWPNDHQLDFDRLRDAGLRAFEGVPQVIYARTVALVGNAVYFAVGFAVLIVALYYFFVDGPDFLRRLQRLSPLDDLDEEILFDRFQSVCRGVVLATIASGFVQAVLAGIGFAVAGVDRPVLLGIVTLLFAMIPFVGAAGVWVPVAIYLLFEQHFAAGVFVGIYGTTIVSTADNVVRTYVIHGHGQLHPLVVFVTMLGALRVIGLWGIFIGPLVAAVFYALLTLVHRRLEPEDVGPL